MKASCWFLCLEKSAITFGEGCRCPTIVIDYTHNLISAGINSKRISITQVTQWPLITMAQFHWKKRWYTYARNYHQVFIESMPVKWPWGKGKINYSNTFEFTMTSSNGNIFRVTGLLCREFTGHRWISLTKASDAEFWCFLLSAPEQTVY